MIPKESRKTGERLFVVREKDSLTIYISQSIPRIQEAMLLAWLSAWLFCGCIFIYYLITSNTDGNKIFFLIASAVWFFFFVRISKVFAWRRVGAEIISFSKGSLAIRNAIGRYGKKQNFLIRNVFKFGVIRKSPTNFFAFLDNSFWIIGGDTLGFSYSGQKIQFGKQLGAGDMQILARMTEQALREFKETQADKN